jgi:hypothetical protein
MANRLENGIPAIFIEGTHLCYRSLDKVPGHLEFRVGLAR